MTDSLDSVEFVMALEEAFPDLDWESMTAEEREALVRRFREGDDDEGATPARRKPPSGPARRGTTAKT